MEAQELAIYCLSLLPPAQPKSSAVASAATIVCRIVCPTTQSTASGTYAKHIPAQTLLHSEPHSPSQGMKRLRSPYSICDCVWAECTLLQLQSDLQWQLRLQLLF